MVLAAACLPWRTRLAACVHAAQIDDDMMAELKATKAAIRPTDTLLVVDAMTGQEAAALVKAFNDQADITGAILTKMDGDSRGGAALSVREVRAGGRAAACPAWRAPFCTNPSVPCPWTAV